MIKDLIYLEGHQADLERYPAAFMIKAVLDYTNVDSIDYIYKLLNKVHKSILHKE